MMRRFLLLSGTVGAIASDEANNDPVDGHWPTKVEKWGVWVSEDRKNYALYDLSKEKPDESNLTAIATFQDTLFQTGWGVLEVRTTGDALDDYNNRTGHRITKTGTTASTKFSLKQQGYAAGILEGYLTGHRMKDTITNLYGIWFPAGQSNATEPLWQWFEDQARYVTLMSDKYDKMAKGSKGEEKEGKTEEMGTEENPSTSFTVEKYWKHMGFTLEQMSGLSVGYRMKNKYPDDYDIYELWRDITLVNAVGDMIEVNTTQRKVDNPIDHNIDSNSINSAEDIDNIKNYLRKTGMCSAIFKANADLTDISFGHSSWFMFANTNRIYKTYHFMDSFFAAKSMSFSSYPGYLSSLDDFYLMSNNMVMIQTSLAVLDKKQREKITSTAGLAWQRVRAANQLADDGPAWGQYLGYNNSGTYSNEYMVLDMKKFKSNSPLMKDTFTVVEQIPQLVESGDATKILSMGYFPSFNEPFYPKIADKAGYKAYIEKTKDYNQTYALAPRAEIFRRDAHTADTWKGSFNILRYNEYKSDPLSHGNPYNAICSRGDMPDWKNDHADRNSKRIPSPGGCYDTKSSSVAWAAEGRMKSVVVNGPTHNREVSIFEWKNWPDTVHEGLPDHYAYKPQIMTPKLVDTTVVHEMDMEQLAEKTAYREEIMSEGREDMEIYI